MTQSKLLIEKKNDKRKKRVEQKQLRVSSKNNKGKRQGNDENKRKVGHMR